MNGQANSHNNSLTLVKLKKDNTNTQIVINANDFKTSSMLIFFI